jgi:hypothetical protein
LSILAKAMLLVVSAGRDGEVVSSSVSWIQTKALLLVLVLAIHGFVGSIQFMPRH